MRYDEPPFEDDPPVWKHSGFGIASFIIACAAGLLEFIIVIAAGILESTTPGGIDENSPVAILLGLALFGGLLGDMVGVGLGVAGLCQQRRNKVFAVIGLIFGSVVFLGVVFLMVLGMLME